MSESYVNLSKVTAEAHYLVGGRNQSMELFWSLFETSYLFVKSSIECLMHVLIMSIGPHIYKDKREMSNSAYHHLQSYDRIRNQ
jgi:hypothetical protein